MQSYEIGVNEAGQRLDKFLHKYMPVAGTAFFYKMLRKKNITLNGKKAEGKEILNVGDNVTFFFSEETFAKFRGTSKEMPSSTREKEYERAFRTLKGIQVLYEDENVVILNKPAGILTQKAAPEDVSLNEWLTGYLLSGEKITVKMLETFKPSVCNRLDRNTSGIVLCGKTLAGSQELGRLIKERKIGKFYRTFVKGQIKEQAQINGSLVKEETANKVTVSLQSGFGQEIKTAYVPLFQIGDMTYLEVELITGKTHQIRAHLASIGHPLAGDGKYGDRKWNEKLNRTFGIKWQLLHAFRMEFPVLTGTLKNLSGKEIIAPLPSVFQRILAEGEKNGNVEHQRASRFYTGGTDKPHK